MGKASPRNQKWSPTATELLKRRIASLLTRRLEMFEIVQLLASPTIPGPPDVYGNPTEVRNSSYMVNPKTGNPYGKTTIYRLKDELVAEWKRRDAAKMDDMFGEIIASLEELERRGFAQSDYQLVLDVINKKMKIVGAAAPVKLDVNLSAVDWDTLPAEALERITAGEDFRSVLSEYTKL